MKYRSNIILFTLILVACNDSNFINKDKKNILVINGPGGTSILTGKILSNSDNQSIDSELFLFYSSNYEDTIVFSNLSSNYDGFKINNLPESTVDIITSGNSNYISTKTGEIQLGSEIYNIIINSREDFLEYHPHQLIVEFRDSDIDSIQANEFLEEYNCIVRKRFGGDIFLNRSIYSISLPENITVPKMINIFIFNSMILNAYPNYFLTLFP